MKVALPARRVAAYGGVVLGCLALAPWIARAGLGGQRLHPHAARDGVGGPGARGRGDRPGPFPQPQERHLPAPRRGLRGHRLPRRLSRAGDRGLFAERLQASELASARPWSWLASRLFLAVFLWMSAPTRRRPWPGEARLDASRGLPAGRRGDARCFAFFTFAPLPSVYLPGLRSAGRPSSCRRSSSCSPSSATALGALARVGVRALDDAVPAARPMGEVAFMAFAARPFDAPSEAGHMAKNLSYICVLVGLLGSMYSLFRQADESAAELARINAALQAEIDERARAEQERDRFFDMSVEMLCIAGYRRLFQAAQPGLGEGARLDPRGAEVAAVHRVRPPGRPGRHRVRAAAAAPRRSA